MYDLSPDLAVTAHGPVRLIELNRPDQLNSASEGMHTALAEVWDRVAADHGARAVVLTGRGRAFSAGGNFEVMRRVQRDEAFRHQNVVEARRIITGMVRCPVPVVAAVNGPAVGLGCSLALLSDIVVMADSAHIADPHLQVGLVAGDGGALVLPLIVGLARAKELLFLGRKVKAQDAEHLGLVNSVVPREQVVDEAMKLAQRLAEMPAQALRDTKRAVNLHLERAMSAGLEAALTAERESMHSPEHVALVDKLLAKD
ncbi:enoyl-CoA hydratase/isomerase family protein [Actinomadura sp. LD22]|uniref:Enoyl-CoA hydratase/isomerase family protein n=1 Tax=Actinomadura physcomitrii TaxID=2650748 RepID=A0A6I4MFB6_9ACTN|nr:enoyl-CoA hydratase/isomerase family protein [Actinomadura physcomitrii]MWA00916.1 enoyl-CoA hydratase/isomerase family protein [Actinomadura physcomitrii]